MNSNISLRNLKTIIKTKGYSLKTFSEVCGEKPQCISAFCTGKRIPMSSTLAKFCSVLQVYPSEIISFDDITVNEKYFTDANRVKLPDSFTGEVTYKPLWLFLAKYLEEVNKNLGENEKPKTANDLFNKIEPPRRKDGRVATADCIKNALAARGLEVGNLSKATQGRKDYLKGLPALTRTKLRNDRPLNLEVIYEICKFLGCSIDFVLGYK